MGDGQDIEGLVTNAMGGSVTPSRLHQSKKPGIIRRVLGNETVEGPFTDDIGANDQPHYIFHTTNKVEIPEDLAGEWGVFSLFGRTTFSPGTLIVTESEIVLIYNTKLSRKVRRFDYSSIERVYHQRIPRIERSLNFTRGGKEFSFEMWDTEEFADELSDAAVYISEKSQVEYTDVAYDFDEGQFDDAIDALRNQLDQIGDTAAELDTSFILENATTGAGVGRTPRTKALGFFLGAGYGIWADIHRDESGATPKVDPTQIDPETTAKEMIRWKQFGDQVADKKGGLTGAAIGAGIAIDQQTSGRESTKVLTELDLESVGQQLESGEMTDEETEIVSYALDAYSEGIGTLLADDFFEKVR